MSEVIELSSFRVIQPVVSRYERFCEARRRLISAAAEWASEGQERDLLDAEIEGTTNALKLVADFSFPPHGKEAVS